jgi:hypothetical protein
MFITVFTTAHHWSLSWARGLQPTSSQPYLRSILILSSQVRFGTEQIGNVSDLHSAGARFDSQNTRTLSVLVVFLSTSREFRNSTLNRATITSVHIRFPTHHSVPRN